MSDLISRQAAIEAAEKESTRDGAYGYIDTKSIVELLEEIPSAEPVHGEWIKGYADPLELVATYTCSNCKSMELAGYNFCPNCGAKMGSK